MMETPIILTHCKLYHSLEEIIKNLDEILNAHEKKPIHIYLASPISYLKELSSRYDPELITIGSEMMLDISEGAFTASIAGRLLKESGAHFVLIGSDAERKLKDFRPDMIASKIVEARKNHVLPIVCVSDTQHDYADGNSKEVIKQHLLEAVKPLSPEEQQDLHIIYDAKWINNTNWASNSPGLITAHNHFLDAVKETFDPKLLDKIHLILPIPGYSKDLLPFTESSSAWGYSLGLLNLSFVQATKTIPKETKTKIELEIEETAPTKKPKPSCY